MLKCPSCKVETTYVIGSKIAVSGSAHFSDAVSYSCHQCAAILSIGSDPVIQNQYIIDTVVKKISVVLETMKLPE